MSNSSDKLQMAVRFHQSGGFVEAEQLYREILEIDPNQADAWHLLGVVAVQAKNYELGVTHIRHALTLRPHSIDFLMNLGEALRALGRLEEAQDCYQQGLRQQPDLALAHCRLGHVWSKQGRLEDAVVSYREALRLQPNLTEAYAGLGRACVQLGRLEEAVGIFGEALRLQPDQAPVVRELADALRILGRFAQAEVYYRQAVRSQPNLAQTHFHLGTSLAEQGKLEQAEASFKTALRLQPNIAEVYDNLGQTLFQLGRLEEAVVSFQEALRLQPGVAAVHNNLGIVLWQLGRREEAVLSFGQSVRLDPKLAEAHCNLGNALLKQDRHKEGMKYCQEAIRLRPDLVDAHSGMVSAFLMEGKLNEAIACCERALQIDRNLAEVHLTRSWIWLLQGNFEQGWPEFLWLWRCKDLAPPRSFTQPRWDGSPLNGRSILLHVEYGFGDVIQFVRYASLVKERGGRVLIESWPTLRSLLATCPGIDDVLAEGEPQRQFDVQTPLLSLPAIFRTTLNTIPSEVPYLTADPNLVDEWRERLAPLTGFKVGIVWQGNPDHRNDRWRSIALEQFAPLAEIPGVHLVGLQKGKANSQLRDLQRPFEVHDLSESIDAPTWTFMDSAAVVMNMDLVIGVDTSVIHLAGALGQPAWVLLPHMPEWRWLVDRDDSPWYPTMRLFRHKQRGDWREVIERVRQALEQRLST